MTTGTNYGQRLIHGATETQQRDSSAGNTNNNWKMWQLTLHCHLKLQP